MGEWGQITLFKTRELDVLERVISDLCVTEGLVAVPYSPRKRETWDRMQYGTGATSDRWACALGSGMHGWSIAKTAPLELLAEPGHTGESRLGKIARALGCEALHVSLYDGTAMAIAQASPTGEVVLSGYTMDGLVFHGMEMTEERAMPRIEGNSVPPSIQEALEESLSDGFDSLVEQLAGADWLDVSLRLIEGQALPTARVLSFARPELEKKPPLRVKFALEKHPLGTRYVLDEGVWLTGGSIDASDAKTGAAFVQKVAHWLDVPVSLEPSVPRSLFSIRSTPEETDPRPGVETELYSFGDNGGSEFILRIQKQQGTADIEERSPHQRRHLISQLIHGLTGARASANALYRDFQRVVEEPTTHALGTFAGERLITAWWRLGKSAIVIEGQPVLELPGLCTAIAAAGNKVALTLVTPRHVNGYSQGYGHEDPVTLRVIDIDTGDEHEVLRSDEHLMFGFSMLGFAGGVLGVRAERDGVPVVVTLDGDVVSEHPGDFRQWLRASTPLPFQVDGLYSTYETPILRAGPDAVIVAEEASPVRERAISVLDLKTRELHAFSDASGLAPVAFSARGARCLARIDDRRLFVGSRMESSR
ncbi:hypothetical protein [Corallococcus carmarthensis]|uniref:hypothetical protein n=1 Tax=Corallococcus carmarthensis TaxID=2316728 RepID=UPI00148E6AD7|nr:hypothetical protein [Corallococcus carmarthensis]NOK16157.1 hypothetical protein [Corallococcus carmarthensis]